MRMEVAPFKEDIDQARAIAKARAVEMWRRGVSRKAISYELGFGLSWLSVHLRSVFGDAARYKTPRNNRLIALWNAGTPISEIGAELGMTDNHVSMMASLLRKRGADIPKRRGGRRAR